MKKEIRGNNKWQFWDNNNSILVNLYYLSGFIMFISLIFVAYQSYYTMKHYENSIHWEKARVTENICNEFLSGYLAKEEMIDGIIGLETLRMISFGNSMETISMIDTNHVINEMILENNKLIEFCKRENKSLRNSYNELRSLSKKFVSYFFHADANEELGYKVCGRDFMRIYIKISFIFFIEQKYVNKQKTDIIKEAIKSTNADKLFNLWHKRYLLEEKNKYLEIYHNILVSKGIKDSKTLKKLNTEIKELASEIEIEKIKIIKG